MADRCHISLLGLIILCSFLTGSSGMYETHVFCSSGENVHLPCDNALSDCASTTWNYKGHLGTVELVGGGKNKDDIERRERLSLSSDCSLNIKKVTKEDCGFYTCRQYVNGQQGTDAHVYLYVLHVSLSSSQTEIRPGSSVTLSCRLYYDGVSCETLVRFEGIQLIWVNQAGVNLQTDSRYHISPPGHCIITLTTTLLNEDHNREWRCQVIQRNELRTSVMYTVKYSGSSGMYETHVFCSSGENVHLPCNNALSDCTSTTWNYKGHLGTVELVAGGKNKDDIERHERLSLSSDCSLNIKKVTKEDCGLYNCRQYVNGQQGTDAHVYLYVLRVSSSSSQTEIRPGSSVTLSCRLYYDGVSCETLVRTEGIQLIWVNQTGVNLQTDSRYQISPPGHCIITLTTTLLNEDHNREWRCQVIQRNELRSSVMYTVKYSGPSITNTAETRKQAIVISAVVAAIAIVLVAVLWVICKKGADNKRGTDSSVVSKDKNEHQGTYETFNMSIPTMPNTNEQTDDVTYSEVTTSSKKQVQMDNNHSYDTVTYAAIRRTE